jgi:hypothetical protein
LAVQFAPKSRTKFSCQIVRDSKAQIRDLSAVTKPLNRGNVLKTLEPKSAISMPRDNRCQLQNYLRIKADRAEVTANSAALIANDHPDESNTGEA